MEFTEILQLILKGLIEGASSKAGDNAFGWLLSFIGISDDTQQFNDIEGQLQTMETQLNVIETEITDIEKVLAEILQQMNWDELVLAVKDSIEDIRSHFGTLQKIQQDDSVTANTLQTWALQSAATELLTINDTVLPGQGGVNPNQPGLIQMFALANAQASIQDPNYNRSAIGQGSPLDVYYSQIEQYFLYLVGVQLQGLTLLVNAYNAAGENDLAQDAIQTFQTNLAKQCQVYLGSIEAFAAYYAPDLTLMDIFGSTAVTASDTPVPVDPLRRAALTIDEITTNTTFYMWMWMGSGENPSSPFCPFSTVGWTSYYTFASNPISQAAGNLPQLIDSAGNAILPDVLLTGDYSVYTVLPSRAGCQWSMFRCSWTNPADGTYQISTQGQQLTTLFLDDHPIVNTLVEPSNGRYYYSPVKTFTFSSQTPANTMRALYSGRTSLWSHENPCYAGDTNAGTGYYNTGLGDFSVQGWFYLLEQELPEDLLPGMTLLSSKSAYGAGSDSDDEAPGASGFLLEFVKLDEFDSRYMITFTIDSGYGYYQVSTNPLNMRDGHWHFITAVRRNYQLEIYLDGQQMSVTSSGNNDPSTISLSACWHLMFGCKNGNSNTASWNIFQPVNFYDGYTNEVSIWTKALSPSEIQAQMTGGLGSDTSGLWGYWPFADSTYNDTTGQAPVENASYHLALRPAPIFYPANIGAMTAGARAK